MEVEVIMIKEDDNLPVGHIWKLDLEEYELRNFGMKFNFSKCNIRPEVTYRRKIKLSPKTTG